MDGDQIGFGPTIEYGLVYLVLVGWILGYTVVRTRSLYMAIGLHAGWVFALRSFSGLTRRNAEPSLWFGAELQTGLASLLLLAATLAALMWLLRIKPYDQEP